MAKLISKLIGDKKQWRAMQARAHALPADYRAVYDDIKKYVWKMAGGDGRAALTALESMLAQFERGAAGGQDVLQVTGADGAKFCDARLPTDGSAFYVATWRHTLNADVSRTLAQ